MGEDPRYFTLQAAPPRKLGQIMTAAIRRCSICNVTVETMGGPGRVSICPQCATLLERGQIKIERGAVLAALAEEKRDG